MPILDPCFMSKIDTLTPPPFFTTFCLILKFQNFPSEKHLSKKILANLKIEFEFATQPKKLLIFPHI